MNQSQRKYALERMADLETAAKANARAKHTIKGTMLTEDQKLKLIAHHQVDLLPKAYLSTYLRNAFDFSHEESEAKTDTKKLEIDLRKISGAFNAARDELMLGDAAKAFDMIKKLEKEWA